jgi:hypothetical protein
VFLSHSKCENYFKLKIKGGDFVSIVCQSS